MGLKYVLSAVEILEGLYTNECSESGGKPN